MALSEEEYLSAVARMQARQESWSRVARSQSSDSDVSGGSSSPMPMGLTPIRQGPGEASGSSSGTGTAARTGAQDLAGIKGKVKRERGERRKKVAKACLACQKSHLTCDEQRPCTRCVKKGIGDQCVEGVRKKAKYLLEGDERDAPVAHPSPSPPTTYSAIPPAVQPSNSNQPAQPSSVSGDVWLAPPLATAAGDPVLGGNGQQGIEDVEMWGTDSAGLGGVGTGNPFDFSTTASSEYQMLDAMLSSMSPVFPGLGDLRGDGSLEPFPSQPQLGSNQSFPGATMASNGSALSSQRVMPLPQHSINPSPANLDSGPAPTLVSPNWPIGGIPASTPEIVDSTALSPWSTWNREGSAPRSANGNTNGHSGNGAMVSGAGGMSPPVAPVGRKPRTGAEVYHTILKPYDYTEGYHYLMDYLAKNFEQKEVLRAVRALASFRPSLIALQMPMSEEDEVFLERSFQRTLIELEKLISYSATPTAVWRRTGEVVYANPEFCTLVGRQGKDLMGGRTYIYRLFAKSSVIPYWENFSVHAFENTTQNYFQPSTLAVGDDQIACSCCFTIRRDVFDLPSVVIGQFLPIPPDS